MVANLPRSPDLSFPEVSAGYVLECLHNRGCVLLRRALPQDRVTLYRNALEAIYERFDERPEDFAEFPDSQHVTRGDVSPMMFVKFSRVSIEELFDDLKLDQVLQNVLGAYRSTLSTFMSVAANPKNAIPGLALHTDSIIQGTDQFRLTLWAPLHPCGTEAPGLAVVPAGREQVLKYLRRMFPGKPLPGWSSPTEWNDTGAFDQSTVTEEFGDVWLPEMAPGDVMLFSNWTIHGSHVTPDMPYRRSAAILRVERQPSAPGGRVKHLLQRILSLTRAPPASS